MAGPPSTPPARRSRRGSGAVTLHDVAKLAGVAPITASRALNTPSQVSEEVRQRVADAIARTGYVPNRLAGGLASTRSRLVAAVVPTISGPVFLGTVQSLTEALESHGYQLMLGQSGYSGSREDALLEAIIGRRPDGIVLTGIMHSAQGRRARNATGADGAGGTGLVFDDEAATQLFLQLGRQDARDQVGRATRREGHQQRNGPAGPGVGMGGAGHQQAQGQGRQQFLHRCLRGGRAKLGRRKQ